MITVADLLAEFYTAEHRFWFIRDARIVDETESAVTLRLVISPEIFVQAFLSEQSGRFSLALVSSSARIYGRDLEHGYWHRHPFGAPHLHEAMPEGMSRQPLTQFLREVELLLLDNELL